MVSGLLYNGQNLDFTGKTNPYGLIQNAGKRKRKSRKCKKSRKSRKCRTSRKTRRH